MKTIRLIGMTLLAAVMCTSFISCNSSDDEVEVPSQKTINVGIKGIGEILNITELPLSKSTGNDLYAIQVYKKDYTELNDYEGTPYAYGVFKDLTNVSIGLLEGSKYCFKVSMVVDGAITGYYFGEVNEYNKFHFSSTSKLWNIDNVPGHDNSFAYDRFYGRLNNYIPTENGTAEIYIKRVAYGAEYIAENLTEGVLNINVSDYYYYNYNQEEYALTLTPENPSNDRIYTFNSITAAYQGNYIVTGYDPVTGDSTYIDNFSETKKITVSWTKANGNITPLGTYNITFKRNVKTVVRIKAEEITNNNAIRITKEETAMVNDDNEYSIEGGNVITTPIGQ